MKLLKYKLRSSLKLILTSFALVCLVQVAAHANEKVNIQIEDVVKKVSSENYTVYQNAIRVYQSREAIQVARLNLLPKLNIWRLAGAAIDIVTGAYTGNAASVATGAMALIEDLAPFLIPANWFRAKEAKILHQADLEGYKALWANELMTAKGLYYQLYFDSQLVLIVEKHRQELESIMSVVKTREIFGSLPVGSTKEIELRILALNDDSRSLKSLVTEEESLLAFMMAMSPATELSLTQPAMPNFESLVPLNYDDFEFRAVDTSPEVRQYDSFITAAPLVKKEVMYSFLGSSSASRGVSGGVFDGLPSQSGLGFGTPAAMRIVSAQVDLLKNQKKGAQEVIRRQLKMLVSNYNLDLDSYRNLKERAQITEELQNRLFEKTKLGQNVSAIDFAEASKNRIQGLISYLGIQYRFLANENKLDRLIFFDDYAKKPTAIYKPSGEKSL